MNRFQQLIFLNLLTSFNMFMFDRWQAQKRQLDAVNARLLDAEASRQALALSEAQRVEESGRAIDKVCDAG
jgi:hypothetical protein